MIFNDITISRRNLPHWEHLECIQFATFHLADSLPQYSIDDIKLRMKLYIQNHPDPWDDKTKIEYKQQFSALAEKYLDAGYGCCCLKNAQCADIMENALLCFNESRYLLHHYVIMPNHVHVLVETLGEYSLGSICKTWKNFTAREINKVTGRKGKLWHGESWDTMIRSENHFRDVIEYINQNIRSGGVRWMTPTLGAL